MVNIMNLNRKRPVRVVGQAGWATQRGVAKMLMAVIIVISGVGALSAPISAQAQSSNAAVLPPIIALLLDEDIAEQVQAIATGQINDTGVTVAGLSATTVGACSAATGVFAQQDCHVGRDATNNNDADGTAGFSFTKVDENGFALEQDAAEWSCVLDNVTGLLWEVKTNDGGLHDVRHTYTWFDTNPATNGGANGVANGGTCKDDQGQGPDCDTESFVNAVNAQGLCGFDDWRMPSIQELAGLMDFGRGGIDDIAIDTDFFPNIRNGSRNYWSGSPFVGDDTSEAWRLGFSSADFFVIVRSASSAVRLVRAGQ